MNISIFNGAGQSDYLYGLVYGLSTTPANKIHVLDINLSAPLFDKFERVKFNAVYIYQKKGSSIFKKALNIMRFYYLQSKHLLFKKRQIVHFQWLERFLVLDRIYLPLLSRLVGHKTVLTVHNVNAGKRDNNDSAYNRFTLYMSYHLCTHLIVHSAKAKQELIADFKVDAAKISIIKHGMNNKVSTKGITQLEAREKLKISLNQKVVLFFGNIDHYKGLDILLDSLEYLSDEVKDEIVLLIAGNFKSKEYIDVIRNKIEESPLKSQIIAHIMFIKDEAIETYFMASDCIVLPYRDIYQSGVLFMAYNFGLPAIATRVGNFENDIIKDKTGFIADIVDPQSIATTIERYFSSTIYHNLAQTRQDIRDWSSRIYSWETIGRETFNLYKRLLNGSK